MPEGTANHTNIARDLLVETAMTVQTSNELERGDYLRNAATASIEVGDRLGVAQGEILYEINESEHWRSWGFASFDDYVEQELDFKKRKKR